jgi:hypothetical protein
MSEYQYYEFQAVDRPLTPSQRDELRAYSSRAKITASSFIAFYNYGDFKGNPEKWMEKYFDAFLYFANWGSHWFMLRLPKNVFDLGIANSYCGEESFTYIDKSDNLILSFRSEDESGGWTEDDGWLTSLLPIRSNLLAGDYRALYLGWLTAVQSEEVEDDILEPTVPPGLGKLNAPLKSLVEFLRIPKDLITVAAESSPPEESFDLSREEISRWIQNISAKEKDEVLFRLVESQNPHLIIQLRQRVKLETGEQLKPTGRPRRTAGEIRARVEILSEERKKIEAAKRVRDQAMHKQKEAEIRVKKLEAMVGKENILWSKVEDLIATRQPKRYDETVSLLLDLKGLADYQGQTLLFKSRLKTLISKNIRKDTLLKGIKKAKPLSEILEEGI